MGDQDCDELDRVTDWELGLPAAHDLTPLSQPLIPPELASAFSISPLSHRTSLDVTRASRSTLSTLRASPNNNNNLTLLPDAADDDEPELDDDDDEEIDLNGDASDSRKLRRIDFAPEEADSALRTDYSSAAAAVKRPRLVWTPQLHKRFVDVVAHLGIKNAVPKTIMQLMNVEGLTRENVASHLQKYRLYLKRMHGISADGPSSSDPLFSEIVGNADGGGGGGHSRGNGHHLPVPIPYPYPPTVMPMAMLGHGYENLPNHPHNMIQQRDWSVNKYAPAVSYHHLAPNHK